MNLYISKSYTMTKSTIRPTIYRGGAAVLSTITRKFFLFEGGG